MLFERDDLIAGLRELVTVLREAGEPVGLRLVGGGVLAMRYFDRGSTADLDAFHVRPGSDELVARAAAEVAKRRGWSDDWLNFKAADTAAEPQMGKAVEWETIFDQGGVAVQIANAEALLAMKLQANRPGRDTDDIRQLMALCRVQSVEEADDLYGEYYPGDALPQRAWEMVERILDRGPLIVPPSLGPIHLS